jgi:glycosyltransferase involved in cell wall biosynthesis
LESTKITKSSLEKKSVGISVLILAQNSEKTIGRTLKSVSSFNEVLVVDGGSTDNTENIVNSYPNTRFMKNPFQGFSKQRNFSIKEARGEWCLVVDSDECVTPELAAELKLLVKGGTEKCLYRIVRTEYITQEEITHGFGSSNYQERFFKRDCIDYRGEVHETPHIMGKSSGEVPELVGGLSFDYRILHNPDVSMVDFIKKACSYSLLKGKERVRQKRRSHPLLVFLNFNWTFLRIFLKSYKQGSRGFMAAIMEAVHRCLVHLLIYEDNILQKEGKQNKLH